MEDLPHSTTDNVTVEQDDIHESPGMRHSGSSIVSQNSEFDEAGDAVSVDLRKSAIPEEVVLPSYGQDDAAVPVSPSNDEISVRDSFSIVTREYEGDDEGQSSDTLNNSMNTIPPQLPAPIRRRKSSASSSSIDNSAPGSTMSIPPSISVGKSRGNVKPAVFQGPPRMFTKVPSQNDSHTSDKSRKSKTALLMNGGKSGPVSSLNLPGTDPVTASAIDEDSTERIRLKIPIYRTEDLKPTFSIDTPLNEIHPDETVHVRPPVRSSSSTTDVFTDNRLKSPLSQEEIDLLVKLETENSAIISAQSDTTKPTRIGSRNSYMQDVFSSTATSPTKESFTDEDQRQLENYATSSNLPNSDGGTSVSTTEHDTDWEFWGKLLNDIENTVKKQNKILVKKLHSGLPKAVRGTIWYTFSRLHPHSFLKSILNPNPVSSVSVVSSTTNNSNQTGATSPTNDRFIPPEAFRSTSLEDSYVELLKLSSPYEKMIIRDLARTFPKHEFFKHADGLGQESLFNVMKAYSLYDPEVGYCQGLSFIVGALLLHMPDEQAFSCLVHLMHTYEFRSCFTPRMELLQLRLYQFDRLVQELLPRINEHLLQEGVRSTMYASQWFLTIFSYRFPLELVFRIMDIIFATGVVSGVSGSEGGVMDVVMERMSEGVAAVSGNVPTKNQDVGTDVAIVLFRFALSLLKRNEEMILALDFEPLLEFLKHGLFQIFIGQAEGNISGDRSPSAGRHAHVPEKAIHEIVKNAMASYWKVLSKKKLLQLRKEYEEELKKSDPEYLAEKSLELQNQRLLSDLKRSEKLLAELNKDHCDLAGQLISVRIELAKEREIQEALRRQITDLKTVLQRDISRFDQNELKAVLNHEVTAENSGNPLPHITPLPLSEEDRIPSVEEQVQILTRQNIQLLEEVEHWKGKYEDMRGTSNSKPNTAEVKPAASMNSWTKIFTRPQIPTSSPTVSQFQTNNVPTSSQLTAAATVSSTKNE